MTKEGEIYKCSICGNIVSVLNAGAGELVCCGEKMDKIVPNTTDAAKEKHVPVIEKIDGGYKIKVGSVTHPMDPDHYIQWIIFETVDGVKYQKNLKPGEAPELVVKTNAEAKKASEYCNKHGAWATQ
ncbi:MAG: desulfoferrodoxin [Methanocorpusculum sp.]|nr:desulfoferrodoxin [Methanocorpusculum sp.]